MNIFHLVDRYLFGLDKGLLHLFSRFVIWVNHLLAIKSVFFLFVVRFIHLWALLDLIWIFLLEHSKFLIIAQLIDINFASSDAFHYLSFNLFNIGLFTSLDLDLMRSNYFHFVPVHLCPFLLFFVICITVADVVFTTIVAMIIGIALSASLTNLIVLFNSLLLSRFITIQRHRRRLFGLFPLSVQAELLFFKFLILNTAAETIKIESFIIAAGVYFLVLSTLLFLMHLANLFFQGL